MMSENSSLINKIFGDFRVVRAEYKKVFYNGRKEQKYFRCECIKCGFNKDIEMLVLYNGKNICPRCLELSKNDNFKTSTRQYWESIYRNVVNIYGLINMSIFAEKEYFVNYFDKKYGNKYKVVKIKKGRFNNFKSSSIVVIKREEND